MSFPIKEFENIPTPFYAYSKKILAETISEIKKQSLQNPAYRVHYAMKANNNPTIVEYIAKEGLGADCVSGNEVMHALKSGVTPDKIVYSGVGKTDNEILIGIKERIGCFNVESEQELDNIATIALKENMAANVAIRINPNIDADTHPSITTGTYSDQFGIPLDLSERIILKAAKSESLNLKGLHFHIGSQITSTEPFRLLTDKVNELNDYYSSKGIHFQWLNVGGGLGIDYHNPDTHPVPDFKSYFDVFKFINLLPDQELHFELGRAVVAQCGSLISRVLYIKESIEKKFAIIDAGFTDLLRPALYGAFHLIENLSNMHGPLERYDVVGPVCESTDCFAHSRLLPTLHRGDLIAIRSTGAYGESMSSNYNMRQKAGTLFY